MADKKFRGVIKLWISSARQRAPWRATRFCDLHHVRNRPLRVKRRKPLAA